jgi:DNA-binding HxlR family transcriptional regulator
MHRISTRQDALLTELRELARTQHDILREVHPDVGEIKEHVVTEQGRKIDEIAQQVTQVGDRVTAPEAVDPEETATSTAAGKPKHDRTPAPLPQVPGQRRPIRLP